VVPGSELPKNRLTKRKDMVTFYGQFGGAPTYLELKASGQFDQEIAEVERAFDMDFASNDYDDLGELCRKRFEMAKDLLGQAKQLRGAVTQQYGVAVPEPNPLFVLPEVMPSMIVTEGGHEKKMLWFARLLDTPEGQEMPNDERNLVSAFIQGHGMLAQGQAIEIAVAMAQAEVASQQPMMDAQMQQQQQLQAGEAQREDAVAQRDAGIADQQAQRDAGLANLQAGRDAQMAQQAQPDPNAEAERQLVMGEVEHERAKELEDRQHAHAMELEAKKAKARPRASA
jgi:hypothetical protein